MVLEWWKLELSFLSFVNCVNDCVDSVSVNSSEAF